ncbi:MAG: preprotein translocase subunit SecG [Spirochaetes bacterium]|jgi:preprotein translocase subunit SecG|nr:preprotein translocase subunit SecG [Spirochaetota bacterium]
MGILITVLTVFFVIICLLIILLVLLQSDRSSGMGIIGGSSQSTFGSSTADVVTKITGFLVALFLIVALALAGLNSFSRGSSKEALEKGTISADSDTTESGSSE